ncbi:MAG: 30S ribosomal protein S15 [Candidatus Carsonella ruddii]
MKNKLLLFNKDSGNIKIQNYFIIKKIKKNQVHFLKNKKDKKCKIIINILLNKIKKNIIYIKKKL